MKHWINGYIITLDDNNNIYNEMITNDGLIIDLGNKLSNESITEVIDLKGNYLFPGFIDAHIHLIGYGRKLLSKNLNKSINKEEVLSIIRSTNNNDRLFFENYFDIGITNIDLDKISIDKPIILRHNDYHSFTVNSYVLDMFNINNSNGILIDDKDTNKVVELWSMNTKDELLEYATTAVNSLKDYGITNVHTDDLSYFNSYTESLDILNEVSSNNKIRINTLIHYDIYDKYKECFKGSKYVKPIQVKLFYDGTLSSKTALLKDNYINASTNGTRIQSYEKFDNIIKRIKANNDSVAIHTIGDLALEEVTSILEKYPSTILKDRIVHGSLARIDTINRLSKLNVAIDIQPLFITSDTKLINDTVLKGPLVYPFKEYIDANIIVNGSSDAPVEDIDPLLSIYTLDNINRIDAIKAYTINPSSTTNENNGIISIGKNADFTIFNKDISTISKEELLSTKVYATVVDDDIYYVKGDK